MKYLNGIIDSIQRGPSYDPDAAAFFARVTAAGGGTTLTEKSAINTLVLSLKANSLWTSMLAIYPMVGSSAASCAQNLVSSAFTGTFSGGWTYQSTGVTPNGTNAYMNTIYNPSTSGLLNSGHLSVYSRTNIGANKCFIGGNTAATVSNHQLGSGNGFVAINSSTWGNFNPTSYFGFLGVSRIASGSIDTYYNGSVSSSAGTLSTVLTNINLYLAANNNNNTANSFCSNEIAYSSIGNGLTSAQESSYYTIVQTFQTSLNRQIDSDALSFFARVVAAGGSLTTTEQNAINQLVISLKANNLWNSMQAIYPMVGASAAACAQNLKSSSFTGTFSGGWTFASTGVTPNGTNAYMNTGLQPSTSVTQNSNHLSYYSRTNAAASVAGVIGSVDNASYFHMHIRYTGNIWYSLLTSSAVASVTNTSTLGFFNANRTTSTNISNFKNGTNLGNTSLTSVTPNPIIVALGALNINNVGISNYSVNECAFSSIGNGFSNTDAANFYTIVQTFQTSLSRQV